MNFEVAWSRVDRIRGGLVAALEPRMQVAYDCGSQQTNTLSAVDDIDRNNLNNLYKKEETLRSQIA